MSGPREELSGRLRLSSPSGPRTSLLLLRLSDAALRALRDCHRLQGRPGIAFQDGGGYLRLPGPSGSRLFSFSVSACVQDGSRGGLDLVRRRQGRSGPGPLRCLGPLRERITVWAAEAPAPARAPARAPAHCSAQPARESSSRPAGGDRPGVDPGRRSRTGLDQAREAPGGISRDQLAQRLLRDQTPCPAREPEPRQPGPSGQRSQALLRQPQASPDGPVPQEGYSTEGLPSRDPGQGEERKEEEEGEEEKEEEEEEMALHLDHSPPAQTGPEPPQPEETPDYFLQFGTIRDAEQRQAYAQAFGADYAEYRALHARVGAVSRRFTQLGAEMKRVQRGSPQHKVLADKIVHEYRKFQKRYPDYREEKRRCEYLHQKLSHIKGLIVAFEEKNRTS
ncbi:RNA polymerase II elongation factor ELL3 isoform X2 [Ornithorhynchus anatinus]|uniref:RNA polymerase II elongation factor ELL3 isoform X2 n=1 Tax=Ornithorhynchus anatinus TaxID=9258 RepID=UPI0010A83263|nr:RNA polymerase II elongation factor ELL3 isoform X2 [Ornithorhynchus anatinus]